MKYIALLPFFLISTAAAFTGLSRQTYKAAVAKRKRTQLPLRASNVDLPEKTEYETVDRAPPKYGWDKELPKVSLERVGQAHTASQWMLNAIESAHWFAFVPALVASNSVMVHHDMWLAMFEGDPLRVTLWMLAPIVSMVAGLAPMIGHIYDDWQVAPTVDPTVSQCNPQVHSDERLRKVFYSVLFTGLGLGSVMSIFAYEGFSLPLVSSMAGMFLYGCLGDKNHLVSDYLETDKPNDVTSIVPTPVSVMIFFVFSQIMLTIMVLFPLASQVENALVKGAIILPPLISTVGGMLESFGAEVKFDQRFHLAASVCMSLAGGVQAWGYFQLGQYLS